MRVILGLPPVTKTSKKDCIGCHQGQEMDSNDGSESRKEKPHCQKCAATTQSPHGMAAEKCESDMGVHTPMLAEEPAQRCESCDAEGLEGKEEQRYSERHKSIPCLHCEQDSLVRELSVEQTIESNRESEESSLALARDTRDECIPFADSRRNQDDSNAARIVEKLHRDSGPCVKGDMRVCVTGVHPNSQEVIPSAASPLLPSQSPQTQLVSLCSESSGEALMSSSHSSMTFHAYCENQRNLLKHHAAAAAAAAPVVVSGAPVHGDDAAEQCVIVSEGDPGRVHHQTPALHGGASCIDSCRLARPKDSAVISMTSFNSLSSDGPMCRICHEGALSDEDLIAPCHCAGSLGYQHKKCLEQWLQAKGRDASGQDACELCDYHFDTQRKGRPFLEWIRQPDRTRDRRNILTDFGCFTLLTPLVCVSTWLCLNGAYHYLNYYQGRGWEGVGLVSLASVLILIYLFWSLMSLRYHCTVWRTWRRDHQQVKVIMPGKDDDLHQHHHHHHHNHCQGPIDDNQNPCHHPPPISLSSLESWPDTAPSSHHSSPSSSPLGPGAAFQLQTII